jgi:hypothetical protein
VLLLADRIGLGPPRLDFIIDLGRLVQPETCTWFRGENILRTGAP